MTRLPIEDIFIDPNHLNTNWSPDVGLWHEEGPGHTFATHNLERVHVGRYAANRLLNVAVMHRLGDIKTTRVLKALRKMQDLDPESKTYGCMHWYAEETVVDDTNAAFFIGLPLIVLRNQYSDRLTPEDLAILDKILGDLKIWFMGAVRDHPCVYYPNKFLGDLVCGWLLLEHSEDEKQMPLLTREMLDAAQYWSDHGWGWGEHMSDGYAKVCLNELSLLLCLNTKIPESVNKAYTGLMNQLLEIEDVYGGNPRVPAVRSYALTQSPENENFRDKVRDWTVSEVMSKKDDLNLGHILNSLNWHSRVAARKPQKTNIRIKCFNKTVAHSWVQDDFRIGSLSSFPLMPTAEHSGWGMAWQSFPVALWKPEGDWAFLQWMVQEDGVKKAHPAIDPGSAYLNNALSKSVSPPIVGRTYALQHGGNILVLRILPGTDINWEMAADQYRIIDNHAKIEALPQKGNWSQLLLDYGKQQFSINHVDLMDIDGPALQKNDFDGMDWRVTWSSKDIQAPAANELGKHLLISIWGISTDGKITNAPQLIPLKTIPMQRNPEQEAYVLKWKWPCIDWHVEIDPQAIAPFIEQV